MAKATYTTGDDGLPVEKVGDWAINKLKILTDYIQASGAARRGYLRNGAAYIDVFSGPGRSLVRSTERYIDGSPVAAFKKAQTSLAAFTSVQVSDDKAELLAAAEKRLRLLRAPVEATPGPASSAIERIVSKLNPHGLHVAFLDPHNLGNLSFTLFESLAKLKHIDIIAHVSVSDMQRNYTGQSLWCPILDGCNAVVNSPYSRVFGVPMSYFGFVYFCTCRIGSASRFRAVLAELGSASV